MSQIYVPGGDRHPYRAMFDEAIGARSLSWRLFVREISSRYRQSIMGLVWAVVSPLFMLVVMLVLRGSGVVRAAEGSVPYPLFLIAGLSVWGLFATTLTECTNALTAASSMITKISFPMSTVVISRSGVGLVEFLIRLPLLLVAMAYFDVTMGAVQIILGLASLIPLFLLALSLGLVASIATALFRDLQFLLPIVLGLLLLLTPVLYLVDPDTALGRVNTWNPLSYLVTTSRDLLVGQSVGTQGYWVCSGLALAGLLLSWRVFYFSHRRVAERI